MTGFKLKALGSTLILVLTACKMGAADKNPVSKTAASDSTLDEMARELMTTLIDAGMASETADRVVAGAAAKAQAASAGLHLSDAANLTLAAPAFLDGSVTELGAVLENDLDRAKFLGVVIQQTEASLVGRVAELSTSEVLGMAQAIGSVAVGGVTATGLAASRLDVVTFASKTSVAAFESLASGDIVLDAVIGAASTGSVSGIGRLNVTGDGLTGAIKAASNGAMVGIAGFSSLSSAATNKLIEAVAYSAVAGVGSLSSDAAIMGSLVTAASFGAVSAIGGLKGATSGNLSDMVASASKGSVTASATVGTDATRGSIVSAATAGSVGAVGEIKGLDISQFAAMVTIVSAASVQAVGDIKGLDSNMFAAMVTAASSGAIGAVGDISGVGADKFSSMVQAATQGAIRAVGDIRNLGGDRLAEMVTAASSGATKAIGDIRGLDARNFSELVTAVSAGATKAVGEIHGVNASQFADMTTAASTGSADAINKIAAGDDIRMRELLSASSSGSTVAAPVGAPDLSNGAGFYNLTVGRSPTATNFKALNKGGTINTCSIKPDLPQGLIMDLSGTYACIIHGPAAAVQAAKSYTLTATNDSGSSTVTIYIAIAAAPAVQASTTTPDPTGPVSISTGATTYNLTVGMSPTNMNFQTINTGAALTACTITPALPSGLVMSTSGTYVCIIHGAPTTAQAATSYTLTATNSVGTTTATIAIAIAAAAPTPTPTPTPPPSGAPNLTAGAGTYALRVGYSPTNMNFQTYNSGAAIDNCSITPALPAGLVMSTSGTYVCIIHAGPSATQDIIEYTLTATNANGSSSIKLRISISN